MNEKRRKHHLKPMATNDPEVSSTSSSSSASSPLGSSSSSDGSSSSSSSSEDQVTPTAEREPTAERDAQPSSSSTSSSTSSSSSSSTSSSSSPSNGNLKSEKSEVVVSASTSPSVLLPTIPRKRNRGMDDNDVSVKALKYQILGRDVDSSRTPDKEQQQQDDQLSKKAPTSLRKEITCVICHEVFIEPTSLSCGHSFCKDCLDWWWEQPYKRGAKDCPTCRMQLPQNQPSIRVNLALRACILALYGDEVQRRILAKTSGERGGLHCRGYEVLTSLNEDSWKRFDYTTSMFAKSESFLQVRHSIVLDAQDQQVQLGLCLCGLPEQKDTTAMIIRLVLMALQEDEVEDQQQFPVFMNAADDDDHNFVCTNQERFHYTFLEVSSCSTNSHEKTPKDNMKVHNYNWAPIARVALDQDENMTEMGVLEFCWKPRNNHKKLRFRHTETGAELELDLSNLSVTVTRDFPQDEDLHDGRQEIASSSFVYDQRDRNLDEADSHNDSYEEDGFLVKDTDESDTSGQFSSANSEDENICCLCNDGGELMICSAGDDDGDIGCGKGFHVSCVGRDEIPGGDWICSCCAKQKASLSLIVGMTSSNPNYGYEFVDSTGWDSAGKSGKKRENMASKTKRHLDDSSSDDGAKDNAELENMGESVKSKDNKKKRRRVIEEDSE